MESCKFSTFFIAAAIMLCLFASLGAAAEDPGSIAPVPAMQNGGMTLQVSGLVAVIASLAAFLF